jgi:DNA-binding LacI/PurR family transcriptional regulator
MPKLQDVAKLAGVSTATVSKVLSNTPYFTEKTRQKVLSAVKELGYKPHFAGRALSRGKTHIVSVVFPYVFDALFKDPLVLAILEGIEDELSKQGYHLLLSTPRLSGDTVDDYFEQVMQSRYADGLIAIDSVPNSPVTHIVNTYNIPLVVLGYHNAPYQVHSDDFTGGQLLMKHLLELGHTKIAMIGVANDKNVAVNERLRGMRSIAQDHDIDFDKLPRSDGDFSTKSGAKAMETLIVQHPHLTAVIAINDRMAIGAMQTLQQRQIRIPQDISVVGYDNLPIAEMTTPPLTTVSQHALQLGKKSAEMLLERLNQRMPSTAVIAPTLITRGSSAKPR